MSKNFIHVSMDTELEYRKVQSVLNEEKIFSSKDKDCSFLLEYEKNLIFVLEVSRQINAKLPLIQKELEATGLHNINITQMYRGNTRNCFSPTFSNPVAVAATKY